MKNKYSDLYKKLESQEVGVYASSQGMFEESTSSESVDKTMRFNLITNRETSESKKLIILNKIMKNKNIWISEQFQEFLLNCDSKYSKLMSNIIKNYDFNLLPSNEKDINRFDAISDIFYKPETLTSDACKYLIPFMAIGNGDYVVIYKDDSVIYYNHDGKKVFEKLNYKDLNDFCNSFLLDKNRKRFESVGADISNMFIKKYQNN